ncbi:MAG TPA: hypothetical protein ENK60_05525 [Anaerolineae bacterium]|nr:hypothetical protein [Anaerolineae bacterium]
MNVIGAILFFICLSFLIVIFGVIVLALYLKRKMRVFQDIRVESEAYHQEAYKYADFHSIGQADRTSADVVDGEFRVLPTQGEEDGS